MTKYIYKSDGPLGDIIISDSNSMSNGGFGLFMEVEIQDFQSVIDAMNDSATRLKKVVVDESGMCNTSASSFLSGFLCCLEFRDNLSEIPFEIKIHRNGKVVAYSRSIISK